MTFTAITRRVALAAALSTATVPLWASQNGTREEAKAMVDAAVAHVIKVGPERAFKDFTDKNNTDWQKKDLYVFAFNMELVNVAHGANERLIGKNLAEMKDPTGKMVFQEFRAAALKGSGWVSYEWPHPQTKKMESKEAFIRKLANFEGFLGVGFYR